MAIAPGNYFSPLLLYTNDTTGHDISSFHTALGQYLNYCQALEEQEADRIVYLAIPVTTYQDFFQLPLIQRSLKRYQVRLIIYNPKLEVISQWIS